MTWWDRLLGRHDDWRADLRQQKMRRWNGRQWDCRPMTTDELEDAEWWNANR